MYTHNILPVKEDMKQIVDRMVLQVRKGKIRNGAICQAWHTELFITFVTYYTKTMQDHQPPLRHHPRRTDRPDEIHPAAIKSVPPMKVRCRIYPPKRGVILKRLKPASFKKVSNSTPLKSGLFSVSQIPRNSMVFLFLIQFLIWSSPSSILDRNRGRHFAGALLRAPSGREMPQTLPVGVVFAFQDHVFATVRRRIGQNSACRCHYP